MNVSVSGPASGELCFAFEPDPADAVVPLPAVWFRYDRACRPKTAGISLMAYLMARQFIGNTFSVSGAQLPAHLASRLHQDMVAHEFFVGSITNIPEKILPDFRHDVLDVCAEERGEKPVVGEAALTCRRSELGYVIAAPDHDVPLLSIATNVDLFAAFTERPRLLPLVLVYLCAFDVLGIRRLRLKSAMDACWLRRVELLLAEVGAGLCPLEGCSP